GDATTNLYRLLINPQTRRLELGAQSLWNELGQDRGHPVFIGLEDVSATALDEATLRAVRRTILDEIARIASWPDGSAELGEFNARVRAKLLPKRRRIGELLSSPPAFGTWNPTTWTWMHHLEQVAASEGFRKSFTFQPELGAIEARLASGKNLWSESI